MTRGHTSRGGKNVRAGKAATLDTLARRLMRPLFGKRGLADGRIVADWAGIAGPLLARSCRPERIAFPPGDRTGGTLHLKVAPGGLATEIQHIEPLLIERINGHFGYRAVARLRLVQGPLPPPPPEPDPAPPLAPEAEATLACTLAGVKDPGLRARLEALGRAVLAPRKTRGKTAGNRPNGP
jgi:hypothetical protein